MSHGERECASELSLKRILSRSKYPKALMNWLIETGEAKDAVIGYDIGCKFSGTIRRSKLLAQKAEEANLKFG